MRDWGLESRDAWNADISIAEFVSQILRILAEDNNGYPVVGLSEEPVVKGDSGDPEQDWKNALIHCADVLENYANDGAKTWGYNDEVVAALEFIKEHFFSLWS